MGEERLSPNTHTLKPEHEAKRNQNKNRNRQQWSISVCSNNVLFASLLISFLLFVLWGGKNGTEWRRYLPRIQLNYLLFSVADVLYTIWNKAKVTAAKATVAVAAAAAVVVAKYLNAWLGAQSTVFNWLKRALILHVSFKNSLKNVCIRFVYYYYLDAVTQHNRQRPKLDDVRKWRTLWFSSGRVCL